MARTAIVGAGLAALAACQVYDFEKVRPLSLAQTTQATDVVAKQLKPNLMLLVDRSGSMTASVPGGSTRIAELKSSMNTFLTGNFARVARMGLALFPRGERNGVPGGQCFPTDRIEIDLPAASQTDMGMDMTYEAKAREINTRIQAISPNGGTPTGKSLEVVGNSPGLNDTADSRADFILLLTDGLPNCNDANVNHTCNGATNLACRCTLGTGRIEDCKTAPSGSIIPCSMGCLDRSGVVEQIQALRQKNIKTIVVGFGADTASGDAPDTLNAMAEAGGFPRACLRDTDCGGSVCENADPANMVKGVCRTKFYQAANGAELGRALNDISTILDTVNICEFVLEAPPSDPRLIAVLVNGTNVAPSQTTWEYAAGKVTFTGTICEDLRNATPQAPVKVQIRVLQQL